MNSFFVGFVTGHTYCQMVETAKEIEELDAKILKTRQDTDRITQETQTRRKRLEQLIAQNREYAQKIDGQIQNDRERLKREKYVREFTLSQSQVTRLTPKIMQ